MPIGFLVLRKKSDGLIRFYLSEDKLGAIAVVFNSAEMSGKSEDEILNFADSQYLKALSSDGIGGGTVYRYTTFASAYLVVAND